MSFSSGSKRAATPAVSHSDLRGSFNDGMRLYDYFASCNCYKVRLLLAHLGRPYERVPIDIFDGDTLTDEYGRTNPSRTTPVSRWTTAAACPSRTRSSS